MACNQILVFSLLTRRLLMMPPSFLNLLIIFLYLTLIGKKHWGFGDKHYWFTPPLEQFYLTLLHTGCMISTFVLPYWFYLGIKKTEYQMIDTVLLVVLLNI